MLTWLGGAPFPRIPVPVYFWLRWVIRKMLAGSVEGRSAAAAVFELSHAATSLLAVLTGVRQGLACKCFVFLWVLLQFLWFLHLMSRKWQLTYQMFACQRVGNKSHKKPGTSNLSEMPRGPFGGLLSALSDPFTEWPKNLAMSRAQNER